MDTEWGNCRTRDMVTLYFRGMAEQNGKPKIGRSARLLGIRPGTDIDVEEVPEVWLDEQGCLKPDLGSEDFSILIKAWKLMVWKQDFDDSSVSRHQLLVVSMLLDEKGYLDLESDLLAAVVRNTKGMSTSLSIDALPPHRKPEKFGGTGRDPLWQIDDSKIFGDLEAVQDSRTHVSIMPRTTMLLARYESALAATQNDWQRVE
ncbi:hypothetical protein LEP3755_51220 [Leptolyngbya sp. NIES-3755]|nr:hypothetical protein LEP3755_51220 [Leptolyngbya sp. NIES-3755]